MMAAADPALPCPLLEIGAGGGFLARELPRVIASEILQVSGVDVVLDASSLPFSDGSLRGVAMTNVLHHLPDVTKFFAEVERCVKAGGAVLMIEPWVTSWSRMIYGSLHHEPFDPESNSWTLEAGKPLSGANGALPWILFERDRAKFTRKFPSLEIESVRPIMPFLYLLSGGVSLRALVPGWSFSFFNVFDRFTARMAPQSAMFAFIVLRRREQ
jgi:SAM-dependent methyltransferase